MALLLAYWLGYSVVLGLIPAMIAKSKGRSFFLWWIYGLFLWLIALVHSLLLKPNEKVLSKQQMAAGKGQCPSCKEWIARDASVCHYCSRNLSQGEIIVPQTTGSGRLISGIVMVCALFLLVLTLTLSKSPGRSTSPESAVDVSQSAPIAIHVTALQLWQDYQHNEVAADNQYKNKTLVVSGVITQISKDFADDAYLELGTPNEFEQIHAELDTGQEGIAAKLSPGEPIQLSCAGNGMTLGSPQLSECTIRQEQANRPSPEVTSPPAPVSLSDASATSNPVPPVAAIPDAQAESQPVAQSSAPAQSPEAHPASSKDAATAALKAAPDVQTRVLPTGEVVLLAGSRPCGIMSHRGAKFIWTSGRLSIVYDDYYAGLAEAYPQCEQRYQSTISQ